MSFTHLLPSSMTALPPAPDDASTQLRNEILLCSTYLTRLQCSPSSSHPDNNDLPLFMDITTLVGIGNHTFPRAENVNAAMGVMTGSSLDTLLLVENAAQNFDAVEARKKQISRSSKSRRKKKVVNANTQRGRQGGQPSTETPVEDSGCASNVVGGPSQIIPDAQRGRELLSRWDDPHFVAQGLDIK